MNWYAVYTKPRQERVALNNLERQSIEAFLPLIRSKRRRGASWVELVEPMFSRYLFARLKLGSPSMVRIRSTRGVTGLVKFGNQLVAVPENLINALLQSADAETGVHLCEPTIFRPGEGVVLTNGPLANLQGIFKAADGEARAILLMNLLGTMTDVIVPFEHMERAS